MQKQLTRCISGSRGSFFCQSSKMSAWTNFTIESFIILIQLIMYHYSLIVVPSMLLSLFKKGQCIVNILRYNKLWRAIITYMRECYWFLSSCALSVCILLTLTSNSFKQIMEHAEMDAHGHIKLFPSWIWAALLRFEDMFFTVSNHFYKMTKIIKNSFEELKCFYLIVCLSLSNALLL